MTVEVRKGALKASFNGTDHDIDLLDLPGTYSLAARSPDELLAVDVVTGCFGESSRPDALVCMADASNLERSLYLFSQAVELRRRRGFDGTVVATGDVLVDQLLQMKRCGFSAAVLREDQSLPVGEKLLRHYPAFYQGDVGQPAPLFVRKAA